MGPSHRPQEDRFGLEGDLKPPRRITNLGTKSRRGEEEEAARFECSTGRRCGENTLGERVKGIEKWRDIENVQKLDKIRSEGLEVWDEVSHFNAKKAYLLQAR